MFVAGSKLTRAITDVVSGRKVTLAVAFWGKEAAARLELPADASHITVACDLLSGACHPLAIEDLLSRGCQVLNVRKLHAKVYASERGIVVTSANASTSGLRLESDIPDELEAGDHQSLVSPSAKAWIKRTVARGTPVSSNDMPSIWDAWINRPVGDRAESFLDVLMAGAEFKSLRVAFYDEEEPEKALLEQIEKSEFYNANLDYEPYYWGTGRWKVKLHDLILDAAVDGDELSCDGVMRVVGVWRNVAFVVREERPFGLSFSKSDRNKFAKALRTPLAKNVIATSPRLQPLDAFARAVRSKSS